MNHYNEESGLQYCNDCEITPEALDLQEYCNNPNCQFIEGIDEVEK